VASGTTDPLVTDFRFDSMLSGNPTLVPGTYTVAVYAHGDDPARRPDRVHLHHQNPLWSNYSNLLKEAYDDAV